MHPIRSDGTSPSRSFCRKRYGMATITGIRERTPRTMHGAIPMPAKQAADTELHSRKCGLTAAMYRVDADAVVDEATAAAMNTQ